MRDKPTWMLRVGVGQRQHAGDPAQRSTQRPARFDIDNMRDILSLVRNFHTLARVRVEGIMYLSTRTAR